MIVSIPKKTHAERSIRSTLLAIRRLGSEIATTIIMIIIVSVSL